MKKTKPEDKTGFSVSSQAQKHHFIRSPSSSGKPSVARYDAFRRVAFFYFANLFCQNFLLSKLHNYAVFTRYCVFRKEHSEAATVHTTSRSLNKKAPGDALMRLPGAGVHDG